MRPAGIPRFSRAGVLARYVVTCIMPHTIHFFSLFAHLSPSQNIIAKHGRPWTHSRLPEKPLHSIASATTLTRILGSAITTHADLRLSALAILLTIIVKIVSIVRITTACIRSQVFSRFGDGLDNFCLHVCSPMSQFNLSC